MATIDDLLDRWEEAREQGKHLSPEELCVDHPELLQNVQAQIEVLLRFESNFGFRPQTGAFSESNRRKVFQPPSLLSMSCRYRMQGCHAAGGLGQVFVAFDEVLRRRVAIKFPRLHGMTAQQTARFEQEARITGQLDHPGIVPIHAMAAEAGGEPSYVMRFVEGRTLDEVVRSSRKGWRVSETTAFFGSEDFRKQLQSLIAVCNTVAFAHDRKILHRDIKPNNILIGPFGETLLLDWGIAKALESSSCSEQSAVASGMGGPPQTAVSKFDHPDAGESSSSPEMQQGQRQRKRQHEPLQLTTSGESPLLTEPGHSPGTPAYASPEQLLNGSELTGPASDIYSLGATLFFILAGQTPLEILGWGDYLQQIRRPDTELARCLPPQVPPALRAICGRCLQIVPAQRYASAMSLADDLDHYLSGDSVSVYRDSLWTQWVRRARRHPTLTGGITTGVVALAAAGAIGAVVVGGKNQQLSVSNNRLAGALSDSEAANNIAMGSLRSMVNESISRRMVQQEELSDSDRDYIRSILQQYLALAALQGDTEQTLAIRAEAEGQVGVLYYHLFQHNDALRHLSVCRSLYQDLRQRRQSPDDLQAVIGYMEILASVQLENAQFAESRDSADEAVSLLRSVLLEPVPGNSENSRRTETEQLRGSSSLANLLIIRGEAYQRLGSHREALRDFREAAALLEKNVASQPEDPALKFSAGNNLRTFASYLNEQSTTESGHQEALRIADMAVSYLESAAQNDMNTFRFPSALAWAYYDRSFVLESLGRIEDAISDMWKAVDLTRTLTERFPLMNSYRQRFPGVLARRCRLFLKAGKIADAFTDARNLSDLRLTRDECTIAIELLQRCLEADRADQIPDRTDAICHIAYLHAQRGRAVLAEGDAVKALADFEESLKQMTTIEDVPIPTLYRSFAYLWSLERIEILLTLRRVDEARSLHNQAASDRDAVRNLFDDSQIESIDRQLESFRIQLEASPQ